MQLENNTFFNLLDNQITSPDRQYNVLGPDPKPEDIELLSNEKHVTAQTPPAFVFHSTEDAVVPVIHADLYTKSLEKAQVPYVFVRGEFGGHGIAVHPFWTGACLEWLGRITAPEADLAELTRLGN